MNNKHLSRKLILTVAPLLLFFPFLAPGFAVAGDWPAVFNFKHINPEKIKNLPLVSTSLLDVQVPVQITKLPLNLRQGTLVVGFEAVFYGYGSHISPSINSSTKAPVGFCLGRKGADGLLSGGSLQKVMAVPSKECRGVIGHDFTVISYAVVKKADQCLPLGIGCKSSGDSGFDCGQVVVTELGKLASMFCDQGFIY